jgi:hypothetical protein
MNKISMVSLLMLMGIMATGIGVIGVYNPNSPYSQVPSHSALIPNPSSSTPAVTLGHNTYPLHPSDPNSSSSSSSPGSNNNHLGSTQNPTTPSSHDGTGRKHKG